MTENVHPFVAYLEELRDREERGALAILRRGLGQPPGGAVEMFRYVVSWLPAQVTQRQEAVYYLVAALFAYHPAPRGEGNLGAAFRRSLGEQEDTTAVERRFAALLAAHPEDLGFYLRQAVSLLRSKEIPVDWHQLFRDLLAWGHPSGYVQKQWARAFWGNARQETAVTNGDKLTAPQGRAE
jgi:CRISPR system Cascade subunit CasB